MLAIHEHPWEVEASPGALVFDRPLHLLYVASGTGITIFRINGRTIHWLGSYTFGVDTHSLMVDEATHYIYIPIPRVGNRPILRIMHYNAG